MIHYTLRAAQLHKHVFDISVSLESQSSEQEFLLPNWIVGSYKIRDFAANIVNTDCIGGDITRTSKNRFVVKNITGKLTLNYQVYGFDTSVRRCYLDENRAFFNGTSVFLLPLGFEQSDYYLQLKYPKNWRVATTMNALTTHEYSAQSYEDLISHPVEIADFKQLDFVVNTIPHSFTISGKHQTDYKQLEDNITTICTHHHALFGNFPVDRYLFLTLATHNEYGGLEHTKSTSLVCARKDLINTQMSEGYHEDYIKFLGLCSHEYFHTWWVKSLKPKSFHVLDLEVENYTTQLWIFEGVTSYYDDLSLLRTKLIDITQYLKLVAKTLNRVLQAAGSCKQSLADASFNAWIHLYGANENTNNSFANYYTKGAIVAFLLDIEIRKSTQNKVSLDEVVKYIYGNFYATGLEDSAFEASVELVTGNDFSEFFADFVYGIAPLPLQNFEYLGLRAVEKEPVVSLGCALKNNKIISVLERSCAEQFGLYVGDEIIAINGEKNSDAEAEIKKMQHGQEIIITFVRDNLTQEKTITLDYTPTTEVVLELMDNPQSDILKNRQYWIG